ncbi:MAG TPA: DUF6596 domain-containing protein [Candidatus Limnocylindrales bacterium]|nr:DUF6596 domain-containing protein [Candidatus Limnocylindrales bacterium]
MTTEPRVDDLLRELAPQVLSAVVRRYGQFDASEDAVQEALLAGATQWPNEGIPDNPRGWLIAVASRRMTDHLRADLARQRREATAAALLPPDAFNAPGPDDLAPEEDDTLTLLFLCCHPSLSPSSQLALTLRAVGGLTTAEIARAFFVPESTMAQRISRAKATIRDSGAPFSLPPASERAERLAVVLHVLYLVFNEGYTASSGDELARTDLTTEAIRLARDLHRLLPADGEATGLLALMLLIDARRPARTLADGSLVPLSEQDRSRWNRAQIDEGVALISRSLAETSALGAYQLQAAIAAVHDEASTADATDWPEIVELYGLLAAVAPNPMVSLNQAVAVAMVDGPAAGLARLDDLTSDDRIAGSHRFEAVRGHLLEMAGDAAAARRSYLAAARKTTSLPERRYLESRAARLGESAAR